MRTSFVLLALSIILFLPRQAIAAAQPESISGIDIVDAKPVLVEMAKEKGVAVVFLSAVCPCSNSHLQELSALAKEYSEFKFLGVHSNTDEAKEATELYFKGAKLPFPVIHDKGAAIANRFKAFKTPHAFLMKEGAVVYQGGVSSSKNFENADRKFLREALEDLKNNRPVKTPEGRTLGCVITRGEKDVW